MPVFTYEGRQEHTGQMVQGVKEAMSHIALGQDLLSEGILLTRYEQKRQFAGVTQIFSRIFQHISTLEKVLFARYFALMLRAGFDVKRALGALQEQTNSKAFRRILDMLYQDIERGTTLADSMAKFPKVFSAIFLSFVRVGEMTGHLQESLSILAEQLQKEYDLKRTVRGAMMYPAVVVSALFAVGLAMLIFVIPKLAEVFEGFNVELPLPTRIILGLGTFFEAYWYLALLGLLLVGVVIWLLLRIHRVKAAVMHAFLYLPLFGPIIQKVNLARFSRNLSSLLSSGVPFIEALHILGDNTPHPSYASALQLAQGHVKQGKPLSEFLVNYKRLFPPLIIGVVKIGEETGEIDKVLKETALFFEAEVDQTMKNFTSVLEPILMVVIGLAVGALAISIISPIYNLVNVI